MSAPTLEVAQTARGKFSLPHGFTIPGAYLLEGHTRIVPSQSPKTQKATCTLTQSTPAKSLDSRAVLFAAQRARNDVVVDLTAVVTVALFEQLNPLLIRPCGATFRGVDSPASMITFREISFTVTPIKLISAPKKNRRGG